MIYIICRHKDEILYDIPVDAKIIINDCPQNFYGEMAAWQKIYKDAKQHGYKTVGIYQARRAFHKDGIVLGEADYDIKAGECYVSKKYVLNSDTIYTQFKVSHKKYDDVLDKILPSKLLNLAKETHFLYPHSMFYTTFDIFEQMFFFVFDYLPAVFHLKKDDDKIFSYVAERLITLFLIDNSAINKCEVTCLRYNKQTKEIDNLYCGLNAWWRK